MDFSIISLGNVEFLSSVLNGVAMISGTGSYSTLIMVGFGIGLLLIGFQCLFEGAQRINLHHLLICMICYMGLFGPQCRVIIEDAYTGQVRTVDNLPIGVGIAGTAISTIGIGLTSLIETGYSPTDRTTEHAFAENLHILSELRSSFASDGLFQAINQELGQRGNGQPSDSKAALINYLSECTMAKIQLGLTSADALRTASWASRAFHFPSEAHYVYLPIGGTGGGANNNDMFSCNAGYQHLEKIFVKLGSTEVKKHINAQLKLKAADGTTPLDNNAVTTAIDDLTGMLADTQDFMRIMLVDGVYPDAASKFYESTLSRAAATATKQAILQRNTQWASESPMFVNASRAMMAFFEGFIYAIVPIMGFLIALGAFGLRLVSKFFLVLIWIQLWLPILAISNLYTTTGVRSAIRSIAGANATSMEALGKIWAEADTWIATGGMLAAATPIISLFLITGSTYAFTTLASRLNGKDHFNERMATPDVANTPSLLSTTSTYSANPMAGTYITGATQFVPKVNLQEAFSQGLSQQKQLAQGQTRQLAAATSDAYQSGQVASNVRSTVQSIGETFSHSFAKEHGEAFKAVTDIAKKYGLNEQETNEVVGKTALSMSGDVNAGLGKGSPAGGKQQKAENAILALLPKFGFNFGGGVSGEASSSDKLSESESKSQSFGDTNDASLTASQRTSLTRLANDAIVKSQASSFADSKSGTHSDTFAKTYSSTVSALNTQSEMESITNAAGKAQSTDFITLAKDLDAMSPTAGDQLLQYGQSLGRGEARKALAAKENNYMRFGLSERQAKMAAALDTMISGKKPEDLHKAATILSSHSGLMNSDAFGANPGPVKNHDAISSAVRSEQSSIAGNVQAGKQSVTEEGKHHQSINEGVRQEARASEAIRNQHEIAQNKALHGSNRGRVHAIPRAESEKQIKEKATNSLGIKIASNTFDGENLKNFSERVLGITGDRNLNFSRSGLTDAQNNLVDSLVKSEGKNTSGVQSALHGVRNELMHNMYRDKTYEQLEPAQKKHLNEVTAGMVNNILDMGSSANRKAAGISVQRYNESHELPVSNRYSNDVAGSDGEKFVNSITPEAQRVVPKKQPKVASDIDLTEGR